MISSKRSTKCEMSGSQNCSLAILTLHFRERGLRREDGLLPSDFISGEVDKGAL